MLADFKIHNFDKRTGTGTGHFLFGGCVDFVFFLWRLSLDWYFLCDGVSVETICTSLFGNRLIFFTRLVSVTVVESFLFLLMNFLSDD